MKSDAAILRRIAMENMCPYDGDLRVAMFVDYVGDNLEARTGLVCEVGRKIIMVVTLASPVQAKRLTRDDIVCESQTGARYDYRPAMLAFIRQIKRDGRAGSITKKARQLLDAARMEVEQW